MKRDNLKIAVIGCGGIGSYFITSLSDLIRKDIDGLDRINPLAINLFDYDLVEEKNLLYQNFEVEHLGLNKAKVLEERTGYKAIDKKLEKAEDLKEYDMIILCVDNNATRQLVYESELPFLDLRANEKNIMAYLTQKNDQNYLELTIDDGNNRTGSCQRAEDVEDKHIQAGNRVIAEIGIQFLLDYLRGEITKKNLIMRI